jgi:predicted nicotinamide N-methyase
VLEVGAGLGLAGLALAQAGFRVVITDYDEDALAFVRASAERNGLLLGAMPALKARKSVVGDPPGAMPDLEAGMSESPGMVTTRPLDWRHPPVEQFPVIIGADVAYYPEHHAPLAALLTACLAPSGDAFISEMNRRGAEPFPALLRARGFDATPYPATAAAISAPGSIDGRTLRGVVWHIRRTH